ncbi:MAG: LysE family translocator [Sinobacteraceae bacterium]|nr:LysE family translocator [Nevskiaceae bacterium]
MHLPLPDILLFLTASLILAVTPGPGVLYLTTQTLSHGRSAGFASVAGIACGNFANALFASLGLAALLAVSTACFQVVKIAGAVYLLVLAVAALRRKVATADGARSHPVSDLRHFRDGLMVALFNPKTALFFAAFLPQFLRPNGGSTLLQSLALAALFVLIAATTDSMYVMAAAALSKTMAHRAKSSNLGRYVSASVFAALGAYALVSDPRPSTR